MTTKTVGTSSETEKLAYLDDGYKLCGKTNTGDGPHYFLEKKLTGFDLARHLAGKINEDELVFASDLVEIIDAIEEGVKDATK